MHEHFIHSVMLVLTIPVCVAIVAMVKACGSVGVLEKVEDPYDP